MELKDKHLLIKDLCARLPYGTIVQVKEWAILDTTLKLGHIARLLNDDPKIKFKPYLRPMLSMTEDEKIEWDAEYAYNSKSYEYEEYLSKMIDWLNAHHFDYRGLIDKGLTLEAPEGMYKEE